MLDIGNRLREARIRKGLTIKDVEEATKIRSKYLEALEEEDFEVLPGPVFVKAFLRTYASFLKVDADDVVEEYRSDHESRREEPVLLRTREVEKSRSRAAEQKKRRARRNQRGYIAAAVLAVIAVGLLAWFGSGRGGGEPATLDSASFSSSESTPGVSATSGPTVTTATDGSSTTTSSTAAATGENVVMVLTVREGSCWLVVREDSQNGAELFAGTLSAGGQKTFKDAKRYWMNVGKPDVLGITINGNVRALEGEAGAFVVTESGAKPESSH
ncbi:MAG: helix-turn-helix domain-containing protein [Actinobacteria bacterium]|nr:helix-turn-helix domain-containing protein [Actinomycetota bacterium]